MTSLPPYRPQLAQLARPGDIEQDHRYYELKLDGYRIGCSIRHGAVRLETRRGHDWTAKFEPIALDAAQLKVKTALLDGEVAILLPNGLTSFQALQNAGAKPGVLVFFVFDLLYLDGKDLTSLPLGQRKQLLQSLLRASPTPNIRYVDHVEGDGARVFEQACKLGAEGIISKNPTASYRPGRSASWLKLKCVKRQEFVVGGFTEPDGARSGIGALLVGYYDAGELRFAGKVGTGKGFTRSFLTSLRQQLDRITHRDCPFTPRPSGYKRTGVHWVHPVLVAEFSYAEFTNDGHLRHPSFLGFRADKRATDVVLEKPFKK